MLPFKVVMGQSPILGVRCHLTAMLGARILSRSGCILASKLPRCHQEFQPHAPKSHSTTRSMGNQYPLVPSSVGFSFLVLRVVDVLVVVLVPIAIPAGVAVNYCNVVLNFHPKTVLLG